tara:strand:+ start:447 stop:1868 length:1422 start_codon:yes stop_codon:yes gene_type:complete
MSLLIPGTNSIKDTGYDVANSVRLDRASSTSFSRSLSSSGNQKTFTLSFWLKRGSNFGSNNYLFQGYANASYYGNVYIDTNDRVVYYNAQQSATATVRPTDQIRDPSAWYHFVLAIDTTQGTDSNRVKWYKNGSQMTSLTTSSYPAQNQNSEITGNGATVYIGKENGGNSFDGYMAEVVLIDGQALDPTSFGEFDSDSPNIWKPKDVSGLTFGTHGFHLDFEDSSALGNDVSGNNNDYTPSNLAATDQSIDTCTNNFATLNPLASITDAPSFSEGNLQAAVTSSGLFGAISTIGLSKGKWYAEFKKTVTSDNDMAFGVISDLDDARNDSSVGSTSNSYAYRETGNKINNASESSYGNSYNTTDIVGIALDLDNNYIYFSKNGTFQNSGDPTSGSSGTGAAFNITAPSSTESGFYFINVGCTSSAQSGTFQCNFGSPPYSESGGNSDGEGFGNFAGSVPAGYFAICTKNLAEYG